MSSLSLFLIIMALAISVGALVRWWIIPAIRRHGDYKAAFEGGLKVQHHKMRERYEDE